MRIQEIKAIPAIQIPIIGGVLAVIIGLFPFLSAFTQNATHNTRSVKQVSSSGSVSSSSQATMSPLLLLIVFIGVLYQLAEYMHDVTLYLISSPLMIGFPLCLTGLYCASNKEDINQFIIDTGADKDPADSIFDLMSFHCFLSIILSFILAYCLEGLGVLEYSGIIGFLFFYLPISVYIFIGFLLPISAGITSTLTYFEINKLKGKSKRKDPVFLFLIFSLFTVSSYSYHKEYTNYQNQLLIVSDLQKERNEKIERGILRDKLIKKLTKNNESALWVTALPEGSKIQIMNIGPKYKDGIVLKPGKYVIRATSNRFNAKEKKYTLKKGINRISIDLTKRQKRVRSR